MGEDKSAPTDIPNILVDAQRGESYERLRFFGKVIITIIHNKN